MTTSKRNCPTCKRGFKKLGTHLGRTPSHVKPIGEYEHEILTGLMLGDGYLAGKHRDNPNLAVQGTNYEFLSWVSDELGWLCGEPNKTHEAGYDGWDSKDLYAITCYNHDELSDYNWYSGGSGKRFPDVVELTPTVLKVWYAGDGGLTWANRNSGVRASITAKSEIDRIDEIVGWFEKQLGLNPAHIAKGQIRFSVGETEELLSYMGEEVPGFGYKWEINSRKAYDQMKEDSTKVDTSDGQTGLDSWT